MLTYLTVRGRGKAVTVAMLIMIIGFGAGCTSSKQLTYFQSSASNDNSIPLTKPYVPTIKRGDILSVQVSSLNAEASAFFNPYLSMASTPDNAATNSGSPTVARPSGYLVTEGGTIELPLIGQIPVAGLTNTQVAEEIRTKLKAYLKEPTVNVRNLSFKVSVLGEVARPALFTIASEQLTIPEALGLAGDLTIYGRRDNVLIIREENGNRTFARINLTRRDAFRSPYYSLHPNDVVYVEPGKSRITTADRTFQLTPIILSIISLIAIVATRR